MIFYTDQGDTPIICTRKDELGLVRDLLGDPGADSGDEEKLNGRKNIWHEEK